MNKKVLLFFAMLLCGFSQLFSQQVSQEEALKSASQFYGKIISPSVKKTNAKTIVTPSLHLVEVCGDKTAPDYYVFDIGQSQGFLLVSGDKRMNQIPLYTLEGNFFAVRENTFYKEFLKSYSDKIRFLRTQRSLETSRKATPLNENLQTSTSVDPFIVTRWSQFTPYNLFLVDSKGGTGYPTGCVSTALAMILKYFNYPDKAQGSENVTFHDLQGKPVGSPQTVTLGDASFDWAHMLEAYPDTEKAPNTSDKNNVYNKAVAYLMKQTGGAVNMRYAPDLSGASTRKAAVSLKNNFKYANTVEYTYKLLYTDQEWAEMLRCELNAKRPVLFSGTNSDGGIHAYLCVGYNESGYFAYNLGWGIAPVWTNTWGADSFILNQEAIIGIQKPEGLGTLSHQVALLSSIHLSKHELHPAEKWNAVIQVANYGMNHYNGECALGLFKEDAMVQLIATQNISAPTAGPNGPIGASGVDLKRTTVLFSDITIPTELSEGRYSLRTLLKQADGSWKPMIAYVKNAFNKVTVTINEDKNVAISYPTYQTVSPLILADKFDMTVAANNIGTAKLSVINVDSLEYTFTGTIYLMGQKKGSTQLPQVFGSVAVDKLPVGKAQTLTINNIIVSPGLYTYYVAYNPASPQGEGIGSVPLLPEKMNYYLYNVPVETVKKTWDFTKELIPESFKMYDNDTLNPKIWGSAQGRNALSFFTETTAMASHTLVTEAIEVTDENTVLEWLVSAWTGKGILPYEMYISTQGQDIQYFKGNPVYRMSDFKKAVASDSYKISLAEYSGKTIYVAFKHIFDGEEGSGISIDRIRLMDIKAPKNVSLLSVSTPVSCEKNKSQDIKIEIKNRAPLKVDKLKVSYSVNAGEPVVEEISYPLAYEEILQYTFRKPIPADEPLGTQRAIEVKVELAGEDSSLLADNRMTVSSQVLNFVPKKNFLLSKYTTLSCTGCRLSSSFLNQLEKRNPATFTGIEIWNNTSLSDPKNTFSAYYSWGTPMFALDGPKNTLPLWGSDTSFWSENIHQILDKKQVVAEVSTTSSLDPESRTLNIRVKSRFALPAKGTYRMTAYVIENGVLSNTGEWHNHIPVGVTSSGTLAQDAPPIVDPQVDVEYEYTATFQLPEQKETRYKPENIQVIGLLFNPKGSIENSSLDSHYVRFNQTDGLTFVSEAGCEPFIPVTEMNLTKNEYSPFPMIRARVASGADFHFHLEKSQAYADKVIRVKVNKTEEIYPDAKGVYTLKQLDQHAFITVEVSDRPKLNFDVMSAGRTLYEGDVLTIDLAQESDDELAMKFNFNIMAQADMTILMKREVISAVSGSRNGMCFGFCYEPEVSVTSALTFQAGVAMEEAMYATYYQPLGLDGVTLVRYTFEATNRDQKKSQMSVVIRYQTPASAFYHFAEQGSLLTLSGTWKTPYFEELDLASQQVACIDLTSATLPVEMPSMTTLNPNRIIYTAEDASTLSTWTNVVKGDKATNIKLMSGYDFKNIKSFLADTLQVEYNFATLSEGQWTSVCLPFDVPEDSLKMTAECYKSFDESGVRVEGVSSLEANRGYIVQPFGTAKHTFTATNVTLPKSLFAMAEVGLNSSFVRLTGEQVKGMYTLSADGNSWTQKAVNDQIQAWSAYLKLPETAVGSSYPVVRESGIELKKQQTIAELDIKISGNTITLRSDIFQWVAIRATDGRLVRLVSVDKEGAVIADLLPGVYLLNHRKVVVGSTPVMR